MKNEISPKYQMKLVEEIDKVLWDIYKSYDNVLFYIKKWHTTEEYNWENFEVVRNSTGKIDLKKTLHNIDGETLLKIAIDMGVQTPDFIPALPTFKNEIKSSFQTANETFEKAFKQIEEHPDVAIGLANSALESILKEILKDDRISAQINGSGTLYELTGKILKIFKIYPNSELPNEINVIGSSMLAINQSIERLRSEKTSSHGKTKDDYIVSEPMYAYFVINSVTTIGLFLNSFYKLKFPSPEVEVYRPSADDLPF